MKLATLTANNRFIDLVRDIRSPKYLPDKGIYIPFGRDFEELRCRYRIKLKTGGWLVEIKDKKKFLLLCLDYGLEVSFVCTG
jgi:hypothetical protein